MRFFHLLNKERHLFPYSHIKSIAAFNLLHVDIWGPNLMLSVHGYRYYLTVVDDFTRHTWISFMQSKSETRNCLTNFINMVETQFSCKVKSNKLDNGPEFDLVSFYSSKGIVH